MLAMPDLLTVSFCPRGPQVTCILMPVEIGWAATVQWLAGDFMCRVLLFLRVFGLYLSNFILVCISIDR